MRESDVRAGGPLGAGTRAGRSEPFRGVCGPEHSLETSPSGRQTVRARDGANE